ncbi:hypothetical protein CWB96_03760 [Pseudoalteromonas citrea]|uniref:Uncharacterized protein n=1 Tax=Pseudoalteromonas citrea TaxID=43655 RepID=A0A5S3XSU5_9GAMM|nr:hypothetical protein CWB97_05250 [Pseudoalteromonas citrea]TMP61412.1 hypothetical protein CWB96_03760 [Pseudoalteromonas citrea]
MRKISLLKALDVMNFLINVYSIKNVGTCKTHRTASNCSSNIDIKVLSTNTCTLFSGGNTAYKPASTQSVNVDFTPPIPIDGYKDN